MNTAAVRRAWIMSSNISLVLYEFYGVNNEFVFSRSLGAYGFESRSWLCFIVR